MKAEYLCAEGVRAAAVAVGGVEKLIPRCFALVLENGWVQHQDAIGIIELPVTLTLALRSVKQTELFPLPPCVGDKEINKSRMTAHTVLPRVFLIHDRKTPRPFLVVLGISAVLEGLAKGVRQHKIDTVKAVAVDNFLGAGIKAHTVIVFVNSSLNGAGTVAVFTVAFPPFILFAVLHSFL